MARPARLRCDRDMKWVSKPGHYVDPATLPKNLTIFAAVAFSATVLYIMFSNSKRPQYSDNNCQVSLSDDEDIYDEDHTTQCEIRCRHSIIGGSERSMAPDRLMRFGIPLEDVQSSSLSRAGAATACMASGPNATNGVGTSSDLNSTCDVNMAAEALTSIESSCTQTQPSTTSTASGSDVTEGVNRADCCALAQIQPLSPNRAPGPSSSLKLMSTGVSTSDQSCEERCDAHKDAGLTRENVHFHYDPERTRANVWRHVKEGESCIKRGVQDVIDENGAENVHANDDDDGGSHFEGYIYGIIREKGSKSYKRCLHGGISFAKEKREQGVGNYSRERIGLGGKVAGDRCQEACTQTGEACGGNNNGGSQMVMEEFRKRNADTVLLPQERCEINPSRDYRRPRHRDSQTQTVVVMGGEECRDKGTSTRLDSFAAFSTREASTGRPLKQTHTMAKEETPHSLLGNNSRGVERCAEERREGGTRGVPSQPIEPLEQAKCSLQALTETQHWSKMSLPEQYEYLELLDSTLAAASVLSSTVKTA